VKTVVTIVYMYIKMGQSSI